MTRLDLLALTPESLATLTNMGLVRRALKENAAGLGPELDESPDGAVTGRFADGIITTLAPGVPIAAGACSCTAAGACRHRVAVALAYRTWHEAGAAAPALPQSHAWSPGDFSDEILQAAIGKRALLRARNLQRRGCTIDVRRGDERQLPEARLPTCTVQFLVPRDLAYARCDCASDQACEHVALAVWAFREADRRVPHGLEVTVDLAPDLTIGTARDPLDEGLAFTREVLLEGAVHLSSAMTARLTRARANIDAAGMTWPGTILDDLDEQLRAYRDRSARYSASTLARLLGELAARRLAITRAGELPVRQVLGSGEARETALGHIRLVSLGARVYGDGSERWAEIFLADTAAGVVLVASKAWNFQTLREEPQHGAALAGRAVASGVSLGTLASGQLVTRAGKRSANRAFSLGSARRDRMSVTMQTREWADLPGGILIRDLARHAEALKSRPPRWLRPRVLAESMHVVEIARVVEVLYSPGLQTLVATVIDPAGVPLRLVRRHRAATPGALEVLAGALTGSPAPSFVSGSLYVGEAGLEMIPVAVLTNRIVVLDLEAGSQAALTSGDVAGNNTPLAAAVSDAWLALVDGAHAGLLHPAVWLDRLVRAGQRCNTVGFHEISARLERMASAARHLQSSGAATDIERQAVARAWEAAAIRVALTQEQL